MAQRKRRSKGGGGPTPKQSRPTLKEKAPASLKNHCFLCLQPSLEESGGCSRNLGSFQPVINYLTGTDPTSHGRNESGEDDDHQEEIPVMREWPQMCGTCDGVLAELYRLHQQLLTVQRLIQKQTELAREIVVKTTRLPTTSSIPQLSFPSTPWDNFMAWIRTDLVGEEDFPTTKLIVHIHDKIIVEAAHQKTAILPSWEPSADFPNNDPTTAPQLQTSGSKPQLLPQSTSKIATLSQSPSVAVSSTAELGFSPVTPIPNKTLPVVKLTRLTSDLPLDIIKYEDVQELEDDQYDHSSSSSSSSGYSPGFENEDMDQLEGMELFLDDDKNDPDFFIPEIKVKKKISKPATVPRPPPVKLPEGSQECDLCGEVMPFPEIEDHLKSHNVQDYITKCPNRACPYVFSCIGKLRSHLAGNRALRTLGSKQCHKAAIRAKISPWRTVSCEVCKAKLRPGRRLINHSLRHEAEMEKNLACPIQDCSERYALKQSMHEHLVEHDLRPSKTPSEVMEQKCSVCKRLLKVKDVADHIKEAHEMEVIITCKLCPFQFHDWESLLDHLYDHRIRYVGLTCFICDDTKVQFTSYWSLRKHYFNVHQIGKQFICEYCDQEIFGLRQLSSHKLKAHTTNAEKKCPKNSTISKSFKCDVCPVKFERKGLLLSHKIKVHQAPPLTCKFCGKSFMYDRTLDNHLTSKVREVSLKPRDRTIQVLFSFLR